MLFSFFLLSNHLPTFLFPAEVGFAYFSSTIGRYESGNGFGSIVQYFNYILLDFDAPVLLVQLVTWTLLHSIGQSGSHLENTARKTQSQFSVSISVISDRNLCIYLSSVVTLVGGSMLGLHLGVQSLAKFCTL